MSIFFASLFSSYVTIFLILYYVRSRKSCILDNDLEAIQKIHKSPVPRIGGVAVFLGLFAGLVLISFKNKQIFSIYLLILISSLPIFFAGLIDDLKKNLNINVRFLLGFLSSLLAGFFLDNWINRVDIFYFDYIFSFFIFSVIFTCFCVVGIINSFNIIDGNNGLASMVSLIVFFGLAYVSLKVGDYVLLISLISVAGSIFGFFIWNYPKGLIFLGDSGAYLIGYLVAQFSILLVTRNEEVSPWFPFLLCLYPIIETLFTIYRRIHYRQCHFSYADSIHLHQIIYRRIISFAFPDSHTSNDIVRKNSLTSPYLWFFVCLSLMPAIIFWDNTLFLIISTIILSLIYLKIYSMIVKFKSPKFLFLGK